MGMMYCWAKETTGKGGGGLFMQFHFFFLSHSLSSSFLYIISYFLEISVLVIDDSHLYFWLNFL